MVKVLTMGKNLHYYGQDDVARDKILNQVTVFVTATKKSQTTDAFTEHVLTLRAHLTDNGMVRYTLFKYTGYNLIFDVCP